VREIAMRITMAASGAANAATITASGLRPTERPP